MFIIKFLRYLLGYVNFTAAGGFPERFINLCTKNKIPLWNLKNSKNVIHASTTIKGYKSIRQSAQRAGVTLKIEEKHGLPFFNNKNKKRVGLIAGLVVIGIIISFLGTRIWTIDVSGNEKIEKDVILSAFAEMGVKVGVSKRNLEPKEISDKVVQKMTDLSWAMVNIKGSKALIEIKESTPAPEVVKDETPSNIVASEDGVITKIHVFAGSQALEQGSAVIKGDLLISGVIKNKNESERLIAADGKVYASSDKTIISTYNNEEYSKISEQKNKYTIYFLGIEIPVFFNRIEENYYKTESYINNKTTTLPIGIIKESAYKTEGKAQLQDTKEQNLLSAHKFMSSYDKLSSEYAILGSDFSATDSNGVKTYTGNYKCEKEIGQKQQIFVEKISD